MLSPQDMGGQRHASYVSQGMPVHSQATMAIWNRAGGRSDVPAAYMTTLSDAVRALSIEQAKDIVANCGPFIDAGVMLGFLSKYPNVAFQARAIHGAARAKKIVTIAPEWEWDDWDDRPDAPPPAYERDVHYIKALSTLEDPVTREELVETLERARALLVPDKDGSESDQAEDTTPKNGSPAPPNSPSAGRAKTPMARGSPGTVMRTEGSDAYAPTPEAELTERSLQMALDATIARQMMDSLDVDHVSELTNPDHDPDAMEDDGPGSAPAGPLFGFAPVNEDGRLA